MKNEKRNLKKLTQRRGGAKGRKKSFPSYLLGDLGEIIFK
jgi:hypothetical protein